LPFNCPDMVGGGELSAMTEGALDQELFVRYAQVAALFPMMQFSMAPWRVLDAEHLSAVLETVRVRQRLVPVILDLARQSAITGEPILRPLAWSYSGCDDVTDQFLLGDDILVAPVLERGASTRRVALPPGSWVLGDEPTASTVSGIVDIPVGLSSLPWFRRIR
ncbi:MAG: glycoside hydrolase, partial [Actinobacteria bacterium]|nr:glycoside hydrolase [Actinomycetota bacterium]